MDVARNIVVSGMYEGKKIKLSGNGIRIETKFKGAIYFDNTTVKSYRILSEERETSKAIYVIMGLIFFVMCGWLLGGIVSGVSGLAINITFPLLGIPGFVWGVQSGIKARKYQIELLFQDGERSVVEVSVPPADDGDELWEYDSGKGCLGGMRRVKYWLFLALKWFCKAVSVIAVGITAIAAIGVLTQEGDKSVGLFATFIILCVALALYQLSLVFAEMGQKAKEEQEPAVHERKHLEWPGVENEASVLEEIEAVNDTIADVRMSEQINRIRDITEKILIYQEKRPEKAALLHSFLGYYLPATLKILKSYGELEGQGVSGGSITGTMERVRGMMDKIVEGFEKQLNQLYQGEAMDIAANVEVLERMMAKDGLTKEEDFPLNL